MSPDDIVLIYHSGGESTVVGMARVASAPRPDPKNAKLTVVDLEFADKLEQPVTLAEIKQSGLFDDWALVRQSRLSTMEAPKAFVDWLRKRNPGIPKWNRSRTGNPRWNAFWNRRSP
jgi:predicted RNA-binding protein with PUA-like domain